ncbi:protein-disulfide reductase DsbD domain-containing protein [Alsobacter sp. R-9]
MDFAFRKLRRPAFPGTVFAVLACVCAAVVEAGPAAAPGASPWSPGLHSAIRLVDGGPDIADTAAWRAGLEFRMDAGFKTYWRTPGDSGLPPTFDWTGSENVADVAVSWPAPYRFDDQAGSSIGYVETVLLPLRVTLADPRKPARLTLKLDYAVCEKICIPARGETQLVLSPRGQSTTHAVALDRAVSRVPRPVPFGDHAAPSIASASATPDGKALKVTAHVPRTPGIVDVFTEGPDGWSFSAPVPLAVLDRPDGSRTLTYRVTVDTRPAGARLADLPLRFTVTAGEEAVETSTKLDGKGDAH